MQGQILTGLKELENNTRGLAGREFRQLLYTPQHPYGRPISGTLDSVPQISRQDLVEFYHENYHPDDATLVVVGDVEAAQVYDLLEHALGTWQPKPAAVLPALPTAMPLDERRSKVRTLTNKTQVDLVLGYVGPARSALDFYAAQVANVILGQLGLMGRLGESVRDRQGLAYYAYSSIEARLGPGPWSIRAGISPNHVSRAVDSILEEIVRLREEPVSDQELEDSQDYLTGGLPLRLETNEGVASLLLNIQLFDLGDDYIERYPSIIRAITKEQVQSAARKYLDPQHYALAIVGPYEEE